MTSFEIIRMMIILALQDNGAYFDMSGKTKTAILDVRYGYMLMRIRTLKNVHEALKVIHPGQEYPIKGILAVMESLIDSDEVIALRPNPKSNTLYYSLASLKRTK